MHIEVKRQFSIAHPGSREDAVAFLSDVRRSLSRVNFIQNLRLEGSDVYADLAVDVPFLGQQLLDFHSRLEVQPDGANLVGLQGSGRAWAMVGGEGRVETDAAGSRIVYALQVTVFVALPSSEKWGGKAFEKMAQATAEKAVERMTLEFPRGVAAAITSSL
jgi:carbon monoxide dehydrogenase subunit G